MLDSWQTVEFMRIEIYCRLMIPGLKLAFFRRSMQGALSLPYSWTYFYWSRYPGINFDRWKRVMKSETKMWATGFSNVMGYAARWPPVAQYIARALHYGSFPSADRNCNDLLIRLKNSSVPSTYHFYVLASMLSASIRLFQHVFWTPNPLWWQRSYLYSAPRIARCCTRENARGLW